jgi:hypothetical protein
MSRAPPPSDHSSSIYNKRERHDRKMATYNIQQYNHKETSKIRLYLLQMNRLFWQTWRMNSRVQYTTYKTQLRTFNMEICAAKTKIMVFQGKDAIYNKLLL